MHTPKADWRIVSSKPNKRSVILEYAPKQGSCIHERHTMRRRRRSLLKENEKESSNLHVNTPGC